MICLSERTKSSKKKKTITKKKGKCKCFNSVHSNAKIYSLGSKNNQTGKIGAPPIKDGGGIRGRQQLSHSSPRVFPRVLPATSAQAARKTYGVYCTARISGQKNWKGREKEQERETNRGGNRAVVAAQRTSCGSGGFKLKTHDSINTVPCAIIFDSTTCYQTGKQAPFLSF